MLKLAGPIAQLVVLIHNEEDKPALPWSKEERKLY